MGTGGRLGSDPPQNWRFAVPAGVPPSHLPGRVAPGRKCPCGKAVPRCRRACGHRRRRSLRIGPHGGRRRSWATLERARDAVRIHRQAPPTLTERSASHQHFADYCDLLAEPKPARPQRLRPLALSQRRESAKMALVAQPQQDCRIPCMSGQFAHPVRDRRCAAAERVLPPRYPSRPPADILALLLLPVFARRRAPKGWLVRRLGDWIECLTTAWGV